MSEEAMRAPFAPAWIVDNYPEEAMHARGSHACDFLTTMGFEQLPGGSTATRRSHLRCPWRSRAQSPPERNQVASGCKGFTPAMQPHMACPHGGRLIVERCTCVHGTHSVSTLWRTAC
eukprot:261188-Chlamydomonas_euryale.AAC.1